MESEQSIEAISTRAESGAKKAGTPFDIFDEVTKQAREHEEQCKIRLEIYHANVMEFTKQEFFARVQDPHFWSNCHPGTGGTFNCIGLVFPTEWSRQRIQATFQEWFMELGCDYLVEVPHEGMMRVRPKPADTATTTTASTIRVYADHHERRVLQYIPSNDEPIKATYWTPHGMVPVNALGQRKYNSLVDEGGNNELFIDELGAVYYKYRKDYDLAKV